MARTNSCVCTHSLAAHHVGQSTACTFCHCAGFRDDKDFEVATTAGELTETQERAFKVLSDHPAFTSLRAEELAEIVRYGRRRLYLGGAVVIQPEIVSQSLHVLMKGEVSVERWAPNNPRPALVGEFGPGNVFGELRNSTHQPATLTVRALVDLETFELQANALAEMYKESADVFHRILREVDESLRRRPSGGSSVSSSANLPETSAP